MKEAKDINGVPLHIGDEVLCVDARGDIYHKLDVATKYEIVYIVDSMNVYAEDVASTNFVALKNTDGFAYRFLLKSPMLIVRNARNEPGLWLCHPNRFAKPK